MSAHLAPIAFALFLWWFATGAILYLDGLPRRTFRWSLAAMTALTAVAVVGVIETRADTTATGAYLAFACGLIIWAWLELAFYAGFITGPRDRPCSCPRGTVSLAHAWHAIETLLYNQLFCVFAAAGLAAATWNQPNTIALWTFLALWILQCSAKLNVFLGVKNLNEAFLPTHMAHLRHFMRQDDMNAAFPFSVTLGTITAVMLAMGAHSEGITAGQSVGAALLATLVALAVLEHWFLILPIPAERLWAWSLHGKSVEHNVQPAVASTQDYTLELTETYDRSALKRLMDGVAGGAFGGVNQMEGLAMAPSGLVRFEASPGHTHIDAVGSGSDTPGHSDTPATKDHVGHAHAKGSRIDQARLQAAFAACRHRRIAT